MAVFMAWNVTAPPRPWWIGQLMAIMRRRNRRWGTMKTILALALVALFAANAAEAKTCTKGKPCGKSCIAVDKTCRK